MAQSALRISLLSLSLPLPLPLPLFPSPPPSLPLSLPLPLQFDADVLGCIRNPFMNVVSAIDTYNDPDNRINFPDNTSVSQ